MINQGFDADTLSLDKQDIPADVSVVVVADPKTALSLTALSKLRNYINNGGNLLIAGEPGKQTILNPILKELGVGMMDGTVVQPSKDLTPDVVLVETTSFAATFGQSVSMLRQGNLKIAMPGVAGLFYDSGTSFRVQPLLATGSKKSWIKMDKLVIDSAQVDIIC